MSNMVSGLFRGHHILPPPSRAQIHATCDEYERLSAQGLSVNEIAPLMGITAGSACVVARWCAERLEGVEPRIEVRL